MIKSNSMVLFMSKAMDENDDGEIDYEEFTTWICRKKG